LSQISITAAYSTAIGGSFASHGLRSIGRELLPVFCHSLLLPVSIARRTYALQGVHCVKFHAVLNLSFRCHSSSFVRRVVRLYSDLCYPTVPQKQANPRLCFSPESWHMSRGCKTQLSTTRLTIPYLMNICNNFTLGLTHLSS
jgi:hypothetical protein